MYNCVCVCAMGSIIISKASNLLTTHEGSQQVQIAGKKRKRVSRWSDAPPSSEATASSSKMPKQSADDIAIAEAMASFDAMPTQAQQKCQMTQAQLQQIREQIEVSSIVPSLCMRVQVHLRRGRASMEPHPPVGCNDLYQLYSFTIPLQRRVYSIIILVVGHR